MTAREGTDEDDRDRGCHDPPARQDERRESDSRPAWSPRRWLRRGRAGRTADPEEGGTGGHVYLIGPIAAGKSTVGEALAASIGCPHVDLDAAVEARCGLPIADLVQRAGVRALRRIERRALDELPERPHVVSTGAGTPLVPATFRVLRRTGVVVWLDVPVPFLAERVRRQAASGAPLHRPEFVAAPDLQRAISEAMEARERRYRKADLRVMAGGAPPTDVVAAVCRGLGLRPARRASAGVPAVPPAPVPVEWRRPPRGPFALMGPDGVGKTTVVRLAESLLEQAGVSALHFHYPTSAPAESLASPPDAADAPPRFTPRLAGFLRHLFFYLAMLAMNAMAGRVSLADRFPLCACYDRRRSRLARPWGWLAARLVPRPRRVYVLDAPPSCVVARKDELSREEVARLREFEPTLLRELGYDHRLVDADRPPEAVAADVVRDVLGCLWRRPRRPVGVGRARATRSRARERG